MNGTTNTGVNGTLRILHSHCLNSLPSDIHHVTDSNALKHRKCVLFDRI